MMKLNVEAALSLSARFFPTLRVVRGILARDSAELTQLNLPEARGECVFFPRCIYAEPFFGARFQDRLCNLAPRYIAADARASLIYLFGHFCAPRVR